MNHTALLIAVMSACTILLRFLPFIVFDHDKGAPSYILYLGRVLPQAVIGMLVVYCLRNTDFTGVTHGIPEMIAVLCVVGLQMKMRNSLLSILAGTAVYMIMIQLL